jgi:hypothetical protein
MSAGNVIPLGFLASLSTAQAEREHDTCKPYVVEGYNMNAKSKGHLYSPAYFVSKYILTLFSF